MQEVTQTVINFYPVAKFVIILFATVGVIDAIKSIAYLIRRGYKDKLDNKKDMHAKKVDAETINALINRYPDVKETFIVKPEKEQNIENNQEIHEINKKIEALEEKLKGWEDAH